MTDLVIPRTGDAAIGALYGLVTYALDRCYRDMHCVAQQVQVSLTCLADALARGDAPQADVLRWSLRRCLGPYLLRTKLRGQTADPSAYRPLRERFRPLWDASLESDAEVLATADRFLSIVLGCFRDAPQILDEAVAALRAPD